MAWNFYERHAAYAPALLVTLLLGACSSDVEEASSTTNGAGGASASSASSGGGPASGSGGATSTSGTSSSTGTAGGPPTACDTLGEPGCLDAFPDCAPVYDDTCCPTCNPGPCADCQNFAFDHCAPAIDVCASAMPTCGTIPAWACTGGAPECPVIGQGGDYACDATPGCVVASCSPDANCGNEHQCHPVGAGSCTALCDAVPPTCPVGFAAEANGSCWTGYCIPGEVCGLQ
jgi:hypothetical protein